MNRELKGIVLVYSVGTVAVVVVRTCSLNSSMLQQNSSKSGQAFEKPVVLSKHCSSPWLKTFDNIGVHILRHVLNTIVIIAVVQQCTLLAQHNHERD